jgi:hypothetical protein
MLVETKLSDRGKQHEGPKPEGVKKKSEKKRIKT